MTASAMDFTKTPVLFLDLILDQCQEEYGIAPCTATGTHGNECYKTRGTCDDTSNYNKGTVTVRLGHIRNPPVKGVSCHNCIESVGMSWTRIDQRRGLGPRGMLTITAREFLDNDVSTDPYYRRRADGTRRGFWRRLLKRNKHYPGRWALLKKGWLESDGTIIESGFTTQRYVLDEITEPDAKGKVKITVKDPIRALGRVKMPVESDGELAAALTDVAVVAAVKSGQGAQYGTPAFHVRIDDEIIKCTARTADSFDTILRGQKGTTAAAHAVDAKVQLCQVWEDATFDTVWSDILGAGGIGATYRDDAGAATETALWLTAQQDAVISVPTPCDKLLTALLRPNGAISWWDDESQKVKIQSIHAIGPGDTVTEIDENNIVLGSLRAKRIHADRITRGFIYYAPKDWSEGLNDPANMARAILTIDAAAESSDEYDETRSDDPIFGYMLALDESTYLQGRGRVRVDRYRDAPMWCTFALEAKDADGLLPGAFVRLTVPQFVDDTGAPEGKHFMLTAKKETAPTVWTFEAEAADYVHYGVWVADDHPDYDDAESNELFAGFWGGATDEYSVWI